MARHTSFRLKPIGSEKEDWMLIALLLLVFFAGLSVGYHLWGY